VGIYESHVASRWGGNICFVLCISRPSFLPDPQPKKFVQFVPMTLLPPPSSSLVSMSSHAHRKFVSSIVKATACLFTPHANDSAEEFCLNFCGLFAAVHFSSVHPNASFPAGLVR
jgi:hypothetical protein